MFISTKKFNKSDYNSLVLSLKSNLKKDKEIDNSILQTNDFMKEAFQLQGKYLDSAKINELIIRRTSQHKGQFLRAKKRLKNSKGINYKYLFSDSIGKNINGVHFIDIALIYGAKKIQNDPKDTLVIVYEMIEINKDFRMNDDIYPTSFTGWLNNLKGKKESYKVN
jgi:hypothetical protein